MQHHDQARAKLMKLLLATIRSRFAELTYSEAAAIANLWVLRRDLLARDVENQVFAALALADRLLELRDSVQQLNPKLRAIYDDERHLVDAVGMTSDQGWLKETLEENAIEIRGHNVAVSSVCSARMVQWAVGQGGFWTASGTYWAQHSERSFEIVFDCGSSTAGALTHALREYRPARGAIDYLFVSHLDKDHTSGFDELLRSYRIDTVVMPLLTPAAALLASARLAAHGGLSPTETELLTDPATYLRGRGAQRVILVQSAPEDSGPDALRASPPTQLPDLPTSAGRSPPRDIMHLGHGGVILANSFRDAELVPHTTTFWLLGPDGRAFWQLAPYVHPFDPLRIGRFMQSAYKLLDAVGGSATTAPRLAALKSVLTSSSGLRDLKRLYKLVRSDHNSLSMSLFSCPCPVSGGRSQLSVSVSRAARSKRVIRPDPPRFGWLHTGDSTLARESYRREWLAYYRDALNHVAVLVAPHHGSRHNFHPEIFSVPAPTIALACAARTNSYGHPAATVARSARASRSLFHQVNEQPDSAVTGLYVG